MNTTERIVNSAKPVIFPAWADSPWFKIVLIMAIALGIFFRLYGLGNKMYSHDEAFTSLNAAGYRAGEAFTSLWDGTDKTVADLRKFVVPDQAKRVSDTYSVLARYEPHEGPVFFLLAHYWMRMVGDSAAAMRGLPALFSLLSIPAMYWLSRLLFSSRRTALLATAFFALSPYQILLAQDARPYSLFTLAALVSSASLLRAMQMNHKGAWLFYSLTLILGVYSHQLFILVAIVHALYFAGKDTLLSREKVGGFLSAVVISLVAFVPWLYLIITRWEHAAARMAWVNMQFPWYRYIQRWILIFSAPFMDLDLGVANLGAYMLRVVLLMVVSFGWLSLLKHGSTREKKFLLLMFIFPAGFFIVPDVLLGGIRSIGGRYFVPASITTVLVMAYFLSNAMDRAKPNTSIRWKSLVMLLFIASIFSNINSLVSETWWNKELGRVRPQLIHEINRDGTVLIVSGYRDTNLGDMLALSLELTADVYFRLYENPDDIQFPDHYDHVYWLPASYEEVQHINQKESIQAWEVIEGTLWQIEGKTE